MCLSFDTAPYEWDGDTIVAGQCHHLKVLFLPVSFHGSIAITDDYKETNDRYYTKTNLTTQGVGIMYKKDFNKWSDLFFWNKWKLRNKRKREETEKVQQQQTDSIADDKAKSELKRKRAQK